MNEKEATDEEVKETAGKAAERVLTLADRKFFGRLTLHFKKGYVYQAIEEKSLKF